MSVGLFCYRRRIVPSTNRDAGFTICNVLVFTRVGLLFIILLGLALLSISPANGETLKLEYALPPPPERPARSVELNEPQGALPLVDALSLALLHNPGLAAASSTFT